VIKASYHALGGGLKQYQGFCSGSQKAAPAEKQRYKEVKNESA